MKRIALITAILIFLTPVFSFGYSHVIIHESWEFDFSVSGYVLQYDPLSDDYFYEGETLSLSTKAIVPYWDLGLYDGILADFYVPFSYTLNGISDTGYYWEGMGDSVCKTSYAFVYGGPQVFPYGWPIEHFKIPVNFPYLYNFGANPWQFWIYGVEPKPDFAPTLFPLDETRGLLIIGTQLSNGVAIPEPSSILLILFSITFLFAVYHFSQKDVSEYRILANKGQ